MPSLYYLFFLMWIVLSVWWVVPLTVADHFRTKENRAFAEGQPYRTPSWTPVFLRDYTSILLFGIGVPLWLSLMNLGLPLWALVPIGAAQFGCFALLTGVMYRQELQTESGVKQRRLFVLLALAVLGMQVLLTLPCVLSELQ